MNINFFEHDTDVQVVPAGTILFNEGDEGDVMYGIQAGSVEITYKDNFIRTLGPSELFGEMALVDREPRSATAVTKSECKLVVIDQSDFLFRVQHHPMFALFVMQTTVQRLREETQRRFSNSI